MYAVIATGGKQVRVQVGDIVKIERLDGAIGDAIVFDQVLLVGEGDSTRLGHPTLEDVKVKGTLVDQDRHAKILVYKSKRRQNSNRRRSGHRQDFTAVKIDAIEA